MESWQQFIPLSTKSYSRYGRIVLTIIFLLAAIFIAVGYDLDEKANFRCNPNKTIAADLTAKNYVLANCYMQYEKEHHPTVPVGRFVVINFGLMLLISIAYVGIVNAKVEKFDTAKAQNNSEIGQEFWEQERYLEGRIFIFPSYILHLFIGRVFPLILFIILIQRTNFPVQFNCSYPIETTMPSNATNHSQPSNHTTKVPKVKITTLFTVECVNPLGDKFKTLATSVLWADCIIGIVAILEIIYLLHRIKKDFDFACDLEFCCMYILEKRNLTIRQILKRFRKRIREDERFQKVLLRFNKQGRALGDFQFRFLVHDELDSEHLRRHEMCNVHLKQDLASVKSRLVYIFPLNNVQIVISNAEIEIFQLAGKILCAGRAGIGKSMVTKAILNRWANYKFLEDNVIILLRFRNFRKNKPTNFKKMLRLGEGIPTGSNFEELYKFILANPKKITLIFDGLDDLKVDIERCLQELDKDTTNDYEERLSMFTIYIKLLKDKLLPGATILTTSRISCENEKIWEHFQIQFETRLELLGFSKHEIIGNVKGFCKANTKASDWIWCTIKNNPEFLSLCYVPETCDLVCSTLKECFDSAVTERDLAKFLPKTMTEMYHRVGELSFGKS